MGCSEARGTSLIPLFLHFFVLIKQLLLQFVVLLLVIRSIAAGKNVASSALELTLHLKTRLLFLELLELFLNNQVVFLLLIKSACLILRRKKLVFHLVRR